MEYINIIYYMVYYIKLIIEFILFVYLQFLITNMR